MQIYVMFILQARQVSCMFGTVLTACIDSVSLKIQNTAYIYTSDNDMFYINDLETMVGNRETNFPLEGGGCSLSIIRPDDRTLKIDVLNLGLTLTMKRHLSLTRYLSTVSVGLKSSHCCSSPPTSGVCGGCTGCTGMENYVACGLSDTVSPPIDVTADHMIPDDVSQLVANDIDLTTVNGLGPGNAACFENATMISERSDVFTADSNDPVTIEFYIKTCLTYECLGTILSYTSVKTFTIRNYYGKIKITFGDFEHQTDLQLLDNEYAQVAIVFDGIDYLTVYVDDCNGNLVREFITLPQYGVHPFSGKGNLVLGKWLPSPDGSGIQPLDEKFQKSCIDVLRIWKR